MTHKYEINQKVIYRGMVATIIGKSDICGEMPAYNLEADSDNELTCTAKEDECEPYNGVGIDESEVLRNIAFNTARTMNMVNGLTDKYFRDGQH